MTFRLLLSSFDVYCYLDIEFGILGFELRTVQIDMFK